MGWRRQFLWRQLMLTPIFGLIMFLIPEELVERVIFGLSVAVLHAVFVLAFYRRLYRRDVRKILMKAGGEDPAEVEIELTEKGPVCRTQSTESRFAWSCVDRVEEETDYIWIWFEPPGTIRIPKRVLSAEEVAGWLEEISRSTAAAKEHATT